jgi:hypothetical protein
MSAFLLLLIDFVADTAADHNAEGAVARKDKRSLPFPFCFWRYRPTKAYFMYSVKWAVLQYVIIRPLVSIAGIVCESLGVLCEAAGFNAHFANVYLEAVDFVSISIALYGLLLFYGLMKNELRGRRPLAKFLSIKLIVMFTFYQSFIFSALEGRVIHGTKYWTSTNVADGLNALAICIEMVFFSALMLWAYTANEYKGKGEKKSAWRALWDSINFSDFAVEIFGSLLFFVRQLFGLRSPQTQSTGAPMDFGQAFGVSTSRPFVKSASSGGESGAVHLRPSYDEHIRLAPYPRSPTLPGKDKNTSAPSPEPPYGVAR